MSEENLPESARVRLLELISLACDDGLSTDEAAMLERALRSNAAARQLYYEFINTHCQLCWPTAEMHSSATLSSGNEATAQPRSDVDALPTVTLVGDQSETPSGSRSNALSAKNAQPKSPVLGFLAGVVDYVSHSRRLMIWLICALLGIYFAAQFGSLLLGRFWAQNAPQVANDRNPTHSTKKPENSLVQSGGLAKVVARVTNAIDCRWKPLLPDAVAPADQNAVAMDAGTEFHAGEKLELTAGLAELTFDSGAKVILHAPSRFSVSDALGGELQLGKLTAKVPHSAAGFSVKTPRGRVVDLGTEFGVKVNFDGTMHVIVYVGEVDVKSGSGGPGAGGADAASSTRVKAGEAVVVEPGKIARSTPPEEERFIRDLAPLGDKSVAEAAYVEFMKKLKPAVWFRMEGKDADRTIHDEMGAARDGEVRWDGPGNPFVKGRVGKGLWLRGPKLRDHVYVADYPKADHNKLSVVAWVYAESRPNHATIAANWHEHTADGQFHFELISYAENAPGIDLCARIMPAQGGHILVNEGPTHPFPLDEWQHVAFTTDGETLRLYRQGKEVASLKHKGLLFPTPIPSLAIGACFNATDKTTGVTPGYWDGKIDELAIFNDALSADDIHKLATAGPR